MLILINIIINTIILALEAHTATHSFYLVAGI